jgi:AsmA-like C-terminal region/Protein of unknown function
MPVPNTDTGRLEVSGQDERETRLGAGETHAMADDPLDRRQCRRSAPSRTRRAAHHCIVWLGSVAAALTLVIGFSVWALMQGPIELDRLTPYVEEALNRFTDGLHVTLSGVRFAIDRDNHNLELQLIEVRLSRPDGEPLAAFSEMSANFSLSELLHGNLIPTRLIVEHPVLHFIRDQEGRIGLRFGDQNDSPSSLGPEIFGKAAGSSNPMASLGSTRRVVVRNATVILDDERTGRHWRADRVYATVERDAEGLAGNLSMALAVGGRAPDLDAKYRYSVSDRTLDLAVEVGAVEPASLAALAPELAPLAAVNFPVSGTFETRVNLRRLTTEGARLDLGFGAGTLKSELLAGGELALRRGALHAVYIPEIGQLRLAKLDIDLDGGSGLVVEGSLGAVTPGVIAGTDPVPASFPGKLGIVLTDVPIAKFGNLWPPNLSRGGRRWVLANVHGGVLDQASVQFDIEVDLAARSAEILSARGSMRYHDLTISYFNGLTPVRKVSGTATLVDKRLEFTPNGGTVKSVQVMGGSLDITNLGAPVEWQTIDLTLAGPIRDVLEVIDVKPLRYAHDIGLDPARVAGRTVFDLHFRFPLLHTLRFEDIEYSIKARMTDAAIAKAAMDRDLSGGNFTIEIGRPGVHLQGNALFDHIPITIDGGVFFKPKDGARARYRVALTLDDRQRRQLAFDYLSDQISGPIGVDLTYSAFGAGRAEAEARLDLRAANLSVAEAGWSKSSNVPGSGRLVFDLANEQITRLREIEVKAAGLYGKFAVALTPDRENIQRVDVDQLVIGDNDIAGHVARRSEGGWRVQLHGPKLNLSYWLSDSGNDSLPRHSAADPPLVIDARLGRLILGPRRQLRDLSAELFREGENWQKARIDARFVNGHELSLRFGSDAGPQALSFLSEDLGATLSLLDVTNNIVGGRIAITGQVADAAGKRLLRGHVDGDNYNLIGAPGLAKALSLTSLSAISSMLAGSGIPFSTLSGDFAYSEKRLVLQNLLAYGGALGVTANGVLELGPHRLDIQGTIVPAYTLNSIIGNIPLVGSLLLGGEGQGLFAANYRATGSAADPQVSVNPLSALTPGFLRRLFQPNFGVPPPEHESLGGK